MKCRSIVIVMGRPQVSRLVAIVIKVASRGLLQSYAAMVSCKPVLDEWHEANLEKVIGIDICTFVVLRTSFSLPN